MKHHKRLYILRILGIILIGWSVYIIYYTMSGNEKKSYWKAITKREIHISFPEWDKPFINQDGKKVFLADDRRVTVLSFVYINCFAVCPRLIERMKRIEKNLAQRGVKKGNVRFLMFSFEDLSRRQNQIEDFIKRYRIDGKNWQLLYAPQDDFGEFAKRFQLKYQVLNGKKFSYIHSTLIAVFDKNGKPALSDFTQQVKASEFADYIANLLEKTK